MSSFGVQWLGSDISFGLVVLLMGASLLAGFIDAIVGGGGLVLLPALFSGFPAAPAPLLLGTNKGTSLCGTTWALMQYLRKVRLDWRLLIPACICAFISSQAGAWAATEVSSQSMRQLLPVILLSVLVYTIMNKDLGAQHSLRFTPKNSKLIACLIAVIVGAYDGFLGPGTGSFFIFLFVRVLGFDFLHASANAKMLNVVTNIAALGLFANQGYVWWPMVLLLALSNVVGGLLGAWLAISKGSGFVRWAFITIVACLCIKSGVDAWSLA